MKIFKRTVSLFLAFCLCAGMLLLQPQSTVSAATTTTPNTKVLRMYPKTQNTSAIHVNLPKGKVCYVKNIKTGSKNLIAKTHTTIPALPQINMQLLMRQSDFMQRRKVNM